VAVIVGEAAVRLRPETSQFAGEAEAAVDHDLPGIAKKAAGLFAAAFAVVKTGEFLKDAVAQASDVSESASKVGVVFGDAAQGVLDFAHTAASSMGLSQAQALEATGTFGNLFRAIGLGQKQSADMSTSLTKLAGDLASFNNTDPTQALDALRAGLLGETEPLRQYGVNLNAAQVQAEAVTLGLAKQGEQLTSAQTAQAAYALIMQQTALAQGDFARTSGGLANQTRIMSAQFADVKANVGAALVPFVQLGAVGITKGLMPALLTGTSYFKDFGDGVTEAENAVFQAYNGMTVTATGSGARIGASLGTLANDAQGYWYTFTDAAKGGGVGMLATEQSFAGSLSRMGNELHGFAQFGRGAFDSLAAGVGPALAPILPTARGVFDTLKASLGQIGAGGGGIGGALESGLSAVIGKLAPMINAALPVVTGFLTNLAGTVQGFLPVLGQIFAQIGPVVSNLFSTLGPAIAQIVPVIMEVAGIWRQVFLGAFEALLPVLPTIVGALGQLVTALASGIAPIFTTLAPVIGQVVQVVQGALIGAISALIPILPTIVDALTQVVGVLGSALLSVLQALAPVIPTIVGVIGQLATILSGALGQALQTIVPILPQLATLFGQLATMIAGALGNVLQALLPILPPIVDALMQVANVLLGALMQALSALMPVIPMLVQAFLALIQAALIPLLPVLPILANLISTVISALAPIIPAVVQVVSLLIQLAIAAIMPLMPIITILANLLGMLVSALAPIIQIVVAVIGVFINLASTVIGVVTGFVSGLIQIFVGLVSAISGIFQSIFSVISGVWNSVFGFVSGIVSKIASAITGVFSGVGNAISGVFSGAVNAVKGVINTIIGVLNGAIDFINSKLIDTANKVPFVNIPHIPHIPTLHEGGIFTSGAPAGEGLALLRDQELVATPEQQLLANDLLASLLNGTIPTPAAGAAGTTGAGVTVVNNVTQQPGEDGTVLAARVTQGVVWNLNAGITRRVGVAGEVTP
jgi:phage-related protein